MADCGIPCHITGLYIFAVVNLCALLNISLVNADVFVIDIEKNSTIDTIQDKQAMFGPDFPDDGIVGQLLYVIPHDACETVHPPPFKTGLPWIALIARGPCHFDQKVLQVQKANFSAAIVHNSVGDNQIVEMAGGELSDQVKIPSVFVGYTDGMALARQYNYTRKSVVIRIEEESDRPPPSFFLPFLVVVSICFVGVVVFSIIKCIKYFQHIRRTRLSKSALKKIPTRKYKKGDHYDTCAICLEDYEEGEKLRVLPCNHTYHCKCIDPWLTKRKKTCPQCKRRVIPGQDSDSDTEGEEDGGVSESTPLLGNNNNRRPGPSGVSRNRASTFERSGLPAAVQPEVVVINEGQTTTNTATMTGQEEGADNSSAEEEEEGEELEGAVGGVGISDRKDFEKDTTNVIVEVEPPGRTPALRTPTPTTPPTAAEKETSDPVDADPASTVASATPPEGRVSPARDVGSINGAFVPSGSSEEDVAGGSSGGSSSGSATSGREERKKRNKRRNNQVV